MRKKDAVNSFDVARLALELGAALEGAFVEKAYQPTREEVLLRFRQPGVGRLDLAIGVGTYAGLTAVPRDNPTTPPSFAVHLRRLLTGCRATGVRQVGFDRVLIVGFARGEERFELVVELFHDGNVVLVKDGTILHPLVHQSFADRAVRPGRPYVEPPPRYDPRRGDASELGLRLRGSDKDVVRALAVEANLGGQWAEEILARAGVPPAAPAASLGDDAVAQIHGTLTTVLAEVQGEARPALALVDGVPVDAAPVPLETWRGLEVRPVPTLSEALDALFAPPPASREKAAMAVVNEKAAAMEHRMRSIESALEGFRRGEAAGRAAGDAVYANFADVEVLLGRVRELHAAGGWDAVTPTLAALRTPDGSVVQKLNPRDGTILVRLPTTDGRTLDVKLHIARSVPENANAMYEGGKKLRDKQAGALAALARARAELDAIRAKGARLDEVIEERTTRAPTKRFWFDAYRWFIASTGHIVIGGRDARTNESAVKKHLEAKDRYVHADLHGAPSVVVKAGPDGLVPDAALDEAAHFAVGFSKAWSSGIAQGEAYWVTPAQVSTTPESGEHLARGAFIVRGSRTYVRTPVVAAVGRIEHEGHAKIMGGPPAALEARADAYVVLRPGRTDPNALAGALARHFGVPLEELQRAMPPGPVEILRAVGIPEGVLP